MKVELTKRVRNLNDNAYVSENLYNLFETLVDEEINNETERIILANNNEIDRVVAGEIRRIDRNEIIETLLTKLAFNEDILDRLNIKAVVKNDNIYFVEKNTFSLRYKVVEKEVELPNRADSKRVAA